MLFEEEFGRGTQSQVPETVREMEKLKLVDGCSVSTEEIDMIEKMEEILNKNRVSLPLKIAVQKVDAVLQKIETADIISTIDRIYASAVIVNEIVEAKSRGKKHKDELQRRYKIIKEERIGSNERRN